MFSTDLNIYSESKPNTMITISIVATVGYNIDGLNGAALVTMGYVGGDFICNNLNDHADPQINFQLR